MLTTGGPHHVPRAGDHPSTLKLAQKVDKYYGPDLLTTRHSVWLAKACRTDPDTLVHQIRHMATNLGDAMQDVIRASAFTRNERRAANHVLDTVAPWTAACAHSMDATNSPFPSPVSAE